MSKQTSHPFSQYGNENTLKNPALRKAFEEFIPFVASANFSDINNEKSRAGMTVDAVMEHFESSVEARHNSTSKSEESLTYLYESEEVIPKSTEGNHYTATIYFHFLNRRLFYAEVRMQIDAYAAQNFITEEAITKILEDNASVEEICALSPQTFGLAQVNSGDITIYELFIPYVDEEDNEKAGFLIFENDKVEGFYHSTLQEEFTSNHNNLMRNLIGFEAYKRKKQSMAEIENNATVVEHKLDKIATFDTLENPASYMAYLALKNIDEELTIGEMKGSGETTGSSPKEVADLLKDYTKPTRIKASAKEEYLIFLFESEQKNTTTNKNRKAELKAYFFEDHLVYVDIYTLDTQFFQNDITPYALNKSELKKGKALDDFHEVSPALMGAGTFVIDGQNYYLAMSPQMQNNNELMAVNYLFKEDTLIKAYAKPLGEAKDDLRNALVHIYFETQKNN